MRKKSDRCYENGIRSKNSSYAEKPEGFLVLSVVFPRFKIRYRPDIDQIKQPGDSLSPQIGGHPMATESFCNARVYISTEVH